MAVHVGFTETEEVMDGRDRKMCEVATIFTSDPKFFLHETTALALFLPLNTFLVFFSEWT